MEDSEKRKALELVKEMRSENKEEDGKCGVEESRLNWMYKGPSDLIDKEEYLLGKAIDRTFELLNSDGNPDVIGRITEQSNVPKRLLEKPESTEQVDIAKKILEDPLYAIKQKEMEARKKLLNNPVKLKQIKQMLLERSKQNTSYKHKKKKKKSEKELNMLIIKKLKKFSDKEKRKALSKIMKSKSSSSSTEENSSGNEKKRKSKRRKRSSSSSSSSSSTSSSSSRSSSSSSSSESEESEEKKSKKKKRKKNKEISSNSDGEKSKKYKKKRLKKSSSSSDSESDSEEEKKKNKRRNKESKRENEKDKIRQRDGSFDDDRKSRRNYGLMMPDGSKPEASRQSSSFRKYSKPVETKQRYVPPPKPKHLSEKEKGKMLEEMVKNAKLRKEDREKSLAYHRRRQALEEKSKTYDEDFMRRQMSELTSVTSMAERIKSNMNNIQRSKFSMDSSFVRK